MEVCSARSMPSHNIDLHRLRDELIRRKLPLWRPARENLDTAPSTLSSWLTGARPAPEGLRERLETALGLPTGTLVVGSDA